MNGGGKRGNPPAKGDTKTGRILSLVLLAGLCVAVALLLVGVVLAVVRPDVAIPGDASLSDLPRALDALEPAGFFTLGFLVLLATPVAGVLAMMVTFLKGERTRIFSGLALVVLLVIVTSAYLGLRG